MCTIEILPDILKAGVCSLKIEGRMKRPEYTAGVVRVYRKYLDRYLEYGAEKYHVDPRDYGELQALYNRGGFSRGYYQVHNGRDMISLTRPSHFEEKGKKAMQEKQRYEALLQEIKKEYLGKDKKETIEGSFQISLERPSELTVRYREAEVHVEGEPGQVPKPAHDRGGYPQAASEDRRYTLHIRKAVHSDGWRYLLSKRPAEPDAPGSAGEANGAVYGGNAQNGGRTSRSPYVRKGRERQR